LPRASLFFFCLALAASVGVACVTSGTSGSGASTCERGVCAKVVRRETFSTRIFVELSAPANASLHNAWVVNGPGPRCRGGHALNAVALDGGIRTNGPLSLSGTESLLLTFAPEFHSGEALDLDVRFPDGPVCLRLPFRTSAPTPSDADGGDV
jgi:hypothetical protein